MTVHQQIADLFLEGWSARSLAARFRRSPEQIEAVLRFELDDAKERAQQARDALERTRDRIDNLHGVMAGGKARNG